MKRESRFFERIEEQMELWYQGAVLAWVILLFPPRVQLWVMRILIGSCVLLLAYVALAFGWAVLCVVFGF